MTRCRQNCHLSLMVVQGKSRTNPQLTPRGLSQIGSVTLTHNLEVTKINFRFLPFDISWKFLCQHRDIFSWTSAMWADQLALSLGQLLLSERLSWQKCFASTSQSGGDIDEAQIGQKQIMAQSSDAFSCLVRFCTLDVFLDAFQINLVTVEPLSQVLKSSIKEEGSCGKPVIFDFTSSPPRSSQLRMPLKYLPIRPSIKCSLGRCKLKDQTIFLREASTKRTTWFKIAQY